MLTHALCWQRDWMQISRRRRSRGRGGPFLGCSVSAVGKTGHSGHVYPGMARAVGGTPHCHAPDLTHVQRGSERIEASHRCGVLAAGQVQAWAPAEGSLNFGLWEHTDEVTLGPTLLHPASCIPTYQVVDPKLVQRTPFHLHIPAQATVERGLHTWCPWALGQGRSQQS